MQVDLNQWVFFRFLTGHWYMIISSSIVIVLCSILTLNWKVSGPNRDAAAVRQREARGPKLYPLIGSQIELLRNLNNIYDWGTFYIQKDPTHTIRFRRPLSSSLLVATGNPANVEHMLKTNFVNYPKGDAILAGLKPLLGDGIFNADGETWRSQRKVASFEFSTKTLRDFVVKIVHHETYDRLLPMLAKANSERTVIDIQDLLMRLGFDTICLLGFGVDVGCLDPSLPEVEFAYAFDGATRLTFQRLLISPTFYPVTAFLASFGIGIESRLNKLVEVIDEFALSIIRKRRQELQSEAGSSESEVSEHDSVSKFSLGHSDLLSRFIQFDEESRAGGNSHQGASSSQKAAAALSDKYLRDIILNFIIAGRDTASVALTWFLWLLSQHPEVEKEIVAEIGSIIEARNGSIPADVSSKAVEGFSYDELREMHYVQAAITEAMRLYPPVPVDSKTAMADDYLPDGTFIQKGDRLSFHPYAMGRLEAVWGKDCLEFKPERFLQNGKFVPENSFKYPIFQAGPRICLGKEMAYTQMKYVIAAIFSSPYRFKLQLPDGKPQYELSLTLKMKYGLKGTVERIEV